MIITNTYSNYSKFQHSSSVCLVLQLHLGIVVFISISE